MLKLRVLDENTQTHVSGVTFTMKQGTITKNITSSMKDTVFYVQLHDGDKLPYGCESIDLRSNDSRDDWSVNCTSVPEGYRNFEPFYLKTLLENRDEHNNQLYTESRSQVSGSTNTTCTNDSANNQCIVTIPVQGGKEVKFFVYDGLDSVHTAQLPNAKLQLCKQDGTEIATFTTDKYGKPTGAGNFTKTLSEGEYFLHLVSGTPSGYAPPADITFKVERVNGLLTLTGTGANASCVDNAESTVTMLVTKPNTKRIQLQVVDAITKQPWAGVNVKVTGKCLTGDMTEKERYYAIDSLANNMHTIDLDLLKTGDITVTIVGSDNKGTEFKDKYHNDSYTNNFVGSKYIFHLSKNSDDTVTLTENSGIYSNNGEIDGSIVKVYAYPQVIVDFNTKRVFAGVGIAGRKSILHIVTSDGAIPTTVNGAKLSTWEVIKENHDHSVGLSLGSYELYEERKTHGYYEILNLPLEFKVTRQTNGFPAVTDWDGKPILDYVTQEQYKDGKGNILPKITAWYESIAHVGS